MFTLQRSELSSQRLKLGPPLNSRQDFIGRFVAEKQNKKRETLLGAAPCQNKSQPI